VLCVQLTDRPDLVTTSVQGVFIDSCLRNIQYSDRMSVVEAIQYFDISVQVFTIFSVQIITLLNKVVIATSTSHCLMLYTLCWVFSGRSSSNSRRGSLSMKEMHVEYCLKDSCSCEVQYVTITTKVTTPTTCYTRARIMDFLWIAIPWQSPWRCRDIVIATSADDRHQTQNIGKACDAHNVRSHIPAHSKHRDNGVRMLTAWRELNNDTSRAVTAVTGIEMMRWPTSDSTGYVATDTSHHCNGSGMPVAAPAQPWCSCLP